MPRLFVAVWPPEKVLDLIAGLDRPAVHGLRWTTRDKWHVTLRFFGQVPEVGPVAEALSSLAARPPVEVTLGPAVARFGRRVLHVPVAGLEGLAAAVAEASSDLGRLPEDRPFTGHVTLARVANRARVDLRPLTGRPVQARWVVDQVCLVESHLGSSGARYEVLATFPLAG